MNREEKIRQQKREWYHRNRDKVLEQQKNSISKKELQKEWYANNKEECIERAKQWNSENLGARKLITNRYLKRKGQLCQWSSNVKR